MKILNPNYVDPARVTAQNLAAKIDAWFAANPGVESITEAQLKASAQLTAAEKLLINAGMVGQMALEKGWKTAD